jgi:hypothetical protein
VAQAEPIFPKMRLLNLSNGMHVYQIEPSVLASKIRAVAIAASRGGSAKREIVNKAKGSTMARKSIEQRLAELDAQRMALKARLGKQERANDTRRKVLLGALVLHRLETTKDLEFTKSLGDWLRRELPGFLTRDNDKALFPDLLAPNPATGDAEPEHQG